MEGNMTMDMSKLKLGKRATKHDARTLQMANYLLLPPVPASKDWTQRAQKPWGMMKNDTLGDCTCAAAGHIIQVWTANAGKDEVTVTDDQVVNAYERITGYDPSDPRTDQGAVEIDVLNYWRRSGIGKHKISAYAALEPKNHIHVRAAVDLFGGAYIGLALPVSAQTQRVWSVPPSGASGTGAPGSWGGHAVVIEAYNAHSLTCITWGQKKTMTWGFWDTYCDEAYALLSPDWVNAKKPSPENFDLAALEADLKSIVG
jgi:hypothetical protein